jgi:hypothetical protein
LLTNKEDKRFLEEDWGYVDDPDTIESLPLDTFNKFRRGELKPHLEKEVLAILKALPTADPEETPTLFTIDEEDVGHRRRR